MLRYYRALRLRFCSLSQTSITTHYTMNPYSIELDFSEHESLTIGILSDTHGVLNPDVADFIKGCDIALHAGDMMGAHTLLGLAPKLGHVIAVKGNNDIPETWQAEDHTQLTEIPDEVKLNLPGGTLIMEHAHRVWNKEISNMHIALREDHPEADLIVYGHTHIRTVDDSAEPMVLNPGAAGEVRVHAGPSCVELTVNADKWEIKEHVFPMHKS